MDLSWSFILVIAVIQLIFVEYSAGTGRQALKTFETANHILSTAIIPPGIKFDLEHWKKGFHTRYDRFKKKIHDYSSNMMYIRLLLILLLTAKWINASTVGIATVLIGCLAFSIIVISQKSKIQNMTVEIVQYMDKINGDLLMVQLSSTKTAEGSTLDLDSPRKIDMDLVHTAKDYTKHEV